MKTIRGSRAAGGCATALVLGFMLAGLTPGAAQTTSSDFSLPVVTLQATTPLATATNHLGVFTVFRSGDTNAALDVHYNIYGSASNGVDYAAIPKWVTIPAGAVSNTIVISPLANPPSNTLKTVCLILDGSDLLPGGASSNYTIAPTGTAFVYLTDLTNLPPAIWVGPPWEGEVFTASATIPIFANGYDLDGYIQEVEFFDGTNRLGIFTNLPPYPPPPPPPGVATTLAAPPRVVWPNVPAGDYTLTAIATDNGGATVTSAPVNITVRNTPPLTNPPPVVSIVEPANGALFWTPTNISLSAIAGVSNGSLASVEFFAGTNSLGFAWLAPVPLIQPAVVCLSCPPPPPSPNFVLTWPSPPPGNYVLTAVATSGGGASATSAPVNISVLSGPPPTNLPPVVSIFIPTNGAVFYVPTNANTETDIELLAKASDPNGSVTNVEFFAGTNDLGPGSPEVLDPPGVNGVTGLVYTIYWRNPSPGNYTLTAAATDNGGASTTSAAVNVTIQPSPPPEPPTIISIISPPDGAVFRAPINLPLFAYYTSPHGPYDWWSVGFYDGTNFLGLAPGGSTGFPVPVPPTALPTNIYELVWSNAPVGNHVLTAQVVFGNLLNSAIGRIVSAPVNITILPPLPPPTNQLPIVSIVASDPVAVEGTNSWIWRGETNTPPTWAAWPTAICRLFTNCGPKTATFTVRRAGNTNGDLTVTYAIGGTASNGVDYVALPGSVTIPSGQLRAFITVVPIDGSTPDENKTIVLTLMPSTNSPPDYLPGYQRAASALIIDSDGLWPFTGLMSGHYFHVHASGPDAAWFCIETSTNLTDWTPVCTNQVVNGSIDYVDPAGGSNRAQFYRVVPLTNAPSN